MKKHIFLVDNDDSTIKMFSSALNEFGGLYKCTCAGSARHAVSMLQYLTPDFIITSNRQPEVNGLQLLEEIKKVSRLAAIPFYLYEEGTNPELHKKVVALGGNGCIEKPQSIPWLRQVLQRLFKQLTLPKRMFR